MALYLRAVFSHSFIQSGDSCKGSGIAFVHSSHPQVPAFLRRLTNEEYYFLSIQMVETFCPIGSPHIDGSGRGDSKAHLKGRAEGRSEVEGEKEREI